MGESTQLFYELQCQPEEVPLELGCRSPILGSLLIASPPPPLLGSPLGRWLTWRRLT